MNINQLSIFLENRAGTLTKVLDLFKEAHLHIIASSIADTAQYGLLRIICSEPHRAYKELERNGVAVALSDVFAVELDERPGQIAEAARLLSEAEIGIVYMYSFFLHGKGLLIIRADRTEEAREVLLRSGLHCVSEKEIASRLAVFQDGRDRIQQADGQLIMGVEDVVDAVLRQDTARKDAQ